MRRAANPWDRYYRQHESPWRGEREVAEILPWLGDGPVLELGCGNGKTLKPLAAAGVDVVGLDISWHILRRHPAKGRLVLGDAAALPFRDAAFTAVLDIHCTGHLDAAGRASAAAEIQRVLQPGGHAVAERLTPNDLRAGQGSEVPGEPGMRAVQDGRQTQFSTAASLVQEYTAAGLVAVGGLEERHHPGHRGRQVTRESARVLFERPERPDVRLP
ncbi:MAG: class I SAM-dependent methyltransferase [Thermoplasmatota archaeon]